MREAAAALGALAAAAGGTAVCTVDAKGMSHTNLASLANPAGLLTMLLACTVGNIILALGTHQSTHYVL